MAEISGKTAVFCVLGHPVGHSLSPAMHNAALRAMGLDGIYVAFDVAPAGLPAAIEGLQALGMAGANCTIPLKEVLLPLMDELSPDAELIGAVNTVVFRDGRRIGHNTDAPGFLADLKAAGTPVSGKAVVLGAGGASRAVVAALARQGVEITLTNRTAARAVELAQRVNERIGAERVRVAVMEPEVLGAAVSGAGLVVNTTSLGMSPEVQEMPQVPPEAFHAGQFVYDLIYNPRETRLLRTARERGARTRHGAGMLARQGALSLELWTGRPAPAELMEQVVLQKLGDAAA